MALGWIVLSTPNELQRKRFGRLGIESRLDPGFEQSGQTFRTDGLASARHRNGIDRHLGLEAEEIAPVEVLRRLFVRQVVNVFNAGPPSVRVGFAGLPIGR